MSTVRSGIDAPICQDKRLGCLRDVSAHAEVCHNTLVDFTGEEAFEAADDLASGPAASRPAGDVVDRRLVEPHADDDRAMEGGVRLSVPAPIETMPAGRNTLRSYSAACRTVMPSVDRVGGRVTPPVTGSPEAVTRLRLPQNGACGFPALRSSQTDSQHSECLQLPMRET